MTDYWFIKPLERSLRKMKCGEQINDAEDIDPISRALHLGRLEAYSELLDLLTGGLNDVEGIAL